MTRFLAALAIACACSPAMAADQTEPVTWGEIAVAAGWALLTLGGLVVAAVVIFILLALAGVFNDWSH